MPRGYITFGDKKYSFFMPKRTRSWSSGKRTTKSSRTTNAITMEGAKTTGRAKNWSGKSQIAYMRGFDPFPAKLVSKLRYKASISLDASTGLPAHYIFRANSIFDPDFTSIGHQPYGTDQLALIYNHYKVIKSNITVVPNAQSLIYGVTLTDDTTVSSSFDTIVEQKGTNVAVIGQSYTSDKKVKAYYSAQNFPGQQTNLVALFNANPAEVQYYDVWMTGIPETSDPSAKDFVVFIEYVVEVSELKDLGQS